MRTSVLLCTCANHTDGWRLRNVVWKSDFDDNDQSGFWYGGDEYSCTGSK